MGRTMRLLSKRMIEHKPMFLRSVMPRLISSSVLEHVVDSNHAISPKEAFSVYFRFIKTWIKVWVFICFVRQKQLPSASLILSYANRSIFCAPCNYHGREWLHASKILSMVGGGCPEFWFCLIHLLKCSQMIKRQTQPLLRESYSLPSRGGDVFVTKVRGHMRMPGAFHRVD